VATLEQIRKRASAVTQGASQICDSVFAATQGDSTEVISAGDFRVNIDSRSASVRGRDLHLSRAEFDVLVFLISHKRRLVTSSTLLSTKVEEESRISRTEFLRALLSLRKKLQEEVPDAQYIQTETWILYDFHAATEVR
jgi:DNA-binding response OmpR family regulator